MKKLILSSMRILNVYFQACLFVVLSMATSPVFGSNTNTVLDNELEVTPSLMLPDTTCGLTDTVIQLTFPTCMGDSDATAEIQLDGDSGPVLIEWDNGERGAIGVNLSVGKHFVTVTTLDGCMLIDSIIIEDKAPLAYSITANDALCVGVANGSISITDTSSLSYLWSTGDSTNMIGNLAGGIYTVTITDTLGCSMVETIPINNSTRANLILEGTNATCVGLNDGRTIVNDTIDDAGYTYLWSTGDTTKSLSNLGPATYFVLVTSPEGCLNADSIDILADREVVINPTIANATCEGVNDGRITINDTMDVTGFRFGWNTGDTTQSVSNLGAGVYTVAVADSSGCINAAAVTVLNTSQLTFSNSVINASCEVASNGSITISDTSDISAYTFNWSTGDSTQMVTNLNNGIYIVTVTDTLGCMESDSIMVGITRTLSASISSIDATCTGVNDGTLTVNDGNDLSNILIAWDTGDSTQMVSGLGAGSYSVILTDSLGCMASDSAILGVGSSFFLEVTSIDPTCEGIDDGSISVVDTIGISSLSFAWSRGDSIQNINGLAAGDYSYTVTDTLGCTEIGMVTLNYQRTIPLVTNRMDVSCVGLSDGSIIVNENDTTNLIYAWSTGDSTNMISGIGAGIYTVTVSDSLGCSASSLINITELNSLNLTLSQTNASCTGLTDGSVTIDEGSDLTGFTINWNTGADTQTLTNVGTGTYIAMVTDTLGCMATDSIEVIADSTLQVGLTGNNIDCVDESTGRISAFAIDLSSSDALTFAWDTGDSTATINNLAAGSYEVTVTDTTGCFGTAGATLEQGDSIQINFVTSPIACMDTIGSGAILAVATGGSGNFTYDWSTGGTNNAIGNLLEGTYVLTVFDSLGCTLTDSVTLVAPPNLIISASTLQDATCDGTEDGSATVVVSGGTSPFDIRWSNGDSTATTTNLNPGTYTVEVSDETGCMLTDTVVIQEITQIDLTLTEINGASSLNDNDGIATVVANGGLAPYTYSWDNGSVGETINNLRAGNNIVVVTDANGCVAMDSINISFFELQVNIIDTRNLRCFEDNRGRATASPVSGIAPFDYLWSTGDTTPTLTNLPAGTHAVTVTDADGKKGRGSVTLTQPAPIYFDLIIIPPGCPMSSNGRITINAINAVGNPLYDFGVGISPSNFILGIPAGVNTFGVIDGNGCRADTTVTIEALAPNPPDPAFNVTSIGLVATFTDQTLNEPEQFLWNFGDGTTSDQQNPIHQYPDTGTYVVTLVATNPCSVDSISQTISITPIPVPGVSLNFGRDTSSLSGQQVSIPVTVGAFEDVAGISGTFELTNPMIGAIQNVRDFNLPNLTVGNFIVQNNLISLEWSVDTSNLISLPTGTQIFTIDLLLTGESDACTQIIATDSEAPLQFTKTFMDNIVPAPFTLNSAEICIAPTVAISGNVSRAQSVNVAGVTVTTNGTVTATTAEDGNYSLPGLPGGATFTIDASKSDEILLGVTTFDVVRILRHILTQQPLTSPYDIIAADVDNSGTVSSLDLVQLQRLILQQIDTFPNNQPWRFVPASYDFINPSNPLTENFPETIEINRLEIDTANIDFVAIKVGDVIADVNAGTARQLPNPMGFHIEEQSFKKGELVKIPFIMDATNEALGFQLELDFDPKKLTFKGATENSYLPLSATNFGQKDIEYGQLKMLWINQAQLPIRALPDGLFQLEFIALSDGQLSNSLRLNTNQFPSQFYTAQVEKIALQPIELIINNAKIETELPFEPTTSLMTTGENTMAGGCADDLDNDGDGLVDCADADCFCECNTMDAEGNLIINPSGDQNINTGGWQEVQGDWTTRGFNPLPQDGSAYFYAGTSEVGQLSQIIDLSQDSTAIADGLVTYIFTGYVRSFDQEPSDQTQILVEYRNAADSTLKTYDSGLVASLTDWQLLTDTTLAPVGTTTAIINLIARRNNGSNNDAFFDNLSLTKMINETCIAPCEDLNILTLTTDAIPNGMGGTASATLANGTGMVIYNWSTGDTTNEVINLMPGTYSVIATDSIGCTVMDSVEIIADSSFFASATVISNTCNNDTSGSIIIEVTGGTTPYSFTWSDTTLMGDTLSNLLSGTYVVTVTDSVGAQVTLTAIVESESMISLNMEDSKIVNESCPNTNDGQLSIVAIGGVAPYQYILNEDTTNNGVYLGLVAGNYTVMITDANGCTVENNITVGLDLSGTLSADFTATVGDSSVALTSAVQDSTATYNWIFGDGSNSTDMNPTVTYAMPGAYEICLTLGNDCGTQMTCQTVTVGATGPVKFVINDLNGIANDTVVVPITVENFVNIVSYQKTLQIQDTSIGRIVGITTGDLAGLTNDNFYQVDDHTITTVWFDASGVGQNLANNTVIYNLMVMVDSQVDTCVELSFVESPVVSQVVGIMVDEVAEVPFELVNGEICTNESVDVTGNIARETGSAVPGVQIGVSNFTKTPTTDIEGNYLIEKLPLGNDYEITPALNTPLLESVSTFDIVLINRHILGTRLFDSPYKHIAADINQSGTITVFDLVLIQRAILGLNNNFPGNAAWRFIPRDYEFIDPNNPLDEDFPESITLTNVAENITGQDFVAVKIADVSYNVPGSSLTTIGTSRNDNQLTLNLANQSFEMGDIIEIPITSEDLSNISGFQLELDFATTDLMLADIQGNKSIGLDANNIGLKRINQGKIQMSWISPNVEFTQASPLFTLQFKAKTSGELSDVLQLTNRYLTSEAYTTNLEVGKVQLVFGENDLATTAPLSIYPNPSTGILNVDFANPADEKVQLGLYNLTGQLVKEWNNITDTSIQLDLNNHLNGTYLVILRKADGVEVKRLVLNR